jgi:hypothetical protein
MTSGSFFVQNSEDALRHVNQLAAGLKKVAIAGWVSGAGCSAMALMLAHFLINPKSHSNAAPGLLEMGGVTLIAVFMAAALLVFSSLYFVAGWGLSHQKSWARYTAAGTFIAKILLCVWLGRGTLAAMIIFLGIAGWDIYGLWVLLSKETGQLFASTEVRQASGKPANLVT